MKKSILVAAASAALFAMGVAHAEEAGPRFVANLGYSFGGDTLVDGTYTNGTSFSIKAGSGFLLSAGVAMPVGDNIEAQLTLGYHSDSSSATNGSVSFSRMPVELLGFYRVDPKWRVGGGLRSATGAKLSTSGAAGVLGSYEFTPSVGAVLEVQYLPEKSGAQRSQWGITGRYVMESFEEKTSKTKVNGNHLGLALAFYY